MRVLLTNDDGIDSPGLQALAAAVGTVAEVTVVAPLEDQSAVGRGITVRRDLEVEERQVPGAARALAVDGTPVDCVRLSELGAAGPPPDLVLSGANLGVNLGDDVTYSGTVAAALEAHLLGRPGIAVSQQAGGAALGFTGGGRFDFAAAARFTAALVGALASRTLPAGLLLNVNVPSGPVRGARLCRLGRRIYRDVLEVVADDGERRTVRIYGTDPSYREEPGTDFAAVAEGCIAVAPLRFDFDLPHGAEWLAGLDLDRLARA